MSDPGINGPMSEFERRAALLFAHAPSVQTLLGVDNSDDAMGKIYCSWDIEEEGDALPTVPVIFITPHYEAMRFSPSKNVDGPVGVSIHVTPPSEYADSKSNARKWFANLLGLACSEVLDLQGTQISGSSGTHMQMVKRETNLDGIIVTIWPCWADAAETSLPQSADGMQTLIAALELHLEP
jgi:hypothetical protein